MALAKTLITTFLGLAVSVNAAPLVERQDVSAPYLNTAAQAAGKLWFGTAIDTTTAEVSDSAYMTVFNNSKIFGQTTPGNTMKWVFVEPNQNQFSFDQGQQTVDLAKQTGKLVRCHNLVWQTELPNWVTSPSTPWTNATLLAALQNHITKVVTHYGDSCYSWDVVNEAIDDSANLRSDIFLSTIGPAYIPLAFKYARAAVQSYGGKSKLFYNDYNIESPGAKTTAAVNLVKQIQAYGNNIDGVGFESHFIVGGTPSAASQAQAMASFTALGLDIHQTEIDVRFQSLPPSASDLAQQAKDYASTVQACMQTSRCTGITVWDFDDTYSWIPSTFSGQGDACLYWANLTRKPAYDSIYTAIQNYGSSAPISSQSATPVGPATSTKLSSACTIYSTTTITRSSSASSASTTVVGQSTRTSTSFPPPSPTGAPHYGQCGGQGWMGPTTCQSPWVCKAQSQYYSQCL